VTIRGAALALTFAVCSSATAQTSAGALAGVVVDAATQAPLRDAVVVARSPALPGEQSAVTDESGAFEMTLLPAGTYSLAVTHEGFQPFSPGGVAIKGGKTRIRIAVAAVPAPASVAQTAIELNDSMTVPSMVSGPDPEYTPDAVERGVEGTMQVRCVITADGQVRSCKVLKGLPFMNGAVLGALERRKYRPALAQGKPVDVYYTFNIRLKLPSQ
jgi:TonB family protein